MAALSPHDVSALSMNMPRINARRSLEFILNVREAMPDDGKGVSPRMVDLVCSAYPDDERARAVLLESLTRG